MPVNHKTGLGLALGEPLVCNCAECRKELTTQRFRLDNGQEVTQTEVAGRIKGRPYCHRCLNSKPSERFESSHPGGGSWIGQSAHYLG